MQTEDLFMIFIAAVLCAAGFVLLKINIKDMPKSTIVYSVIMTAVVLGMTAVLQQVYTDNSFLFNLKRVCLLSLLWPVAYIDFKEYRIPNEFIIAGILYRAAIIPFELIYDNAVIWNNVISELIAAAALLLASVLCRLCIKNSVGAGDIKLFVIMGLMLGMQGIWSAIFMSLAVSFFVSLYLLIKKTKTRKDSIPFGPAIAAGTYISIFMTGM